jgi:hypothetical protein
VQALRAAAGRDPVELAADLGLGAGEVLRMAPELAGPLPAPPPDPPRLEPEQARFRLFDAVASLLRATAGRTPLLLVVDDLQWADVPSLLLLRFLAHDLRDSRILALATYRDPELGPHDPVAELTLSPATADPRQPRDGQARRPRPCPARGGGLADRAGHPLRAVTAPRHTGQRC